VGFFLELLDLSQINEIDRFVEPPGEGWKQLVFDRLFLNEKKGLLCDLLWSDPIDETTGEVGEKITFEIVFFLIFPFFFRVWKRTKCWSGTLSIMFPILTEVCVCLFLCLFV
jgi:hypothetical protein